MQKRTNDFFMISVLHGQDYDDLNMAGVDYRRGHHSRSIHHPKQLCALIAGHEYISDVNEQICRANDPDLVPNMGLSNMNTYWLGQREADVEWLRDVVLPTCKNLMPDIVYLEIGKWDASKSYARIHQIVDCIATIVSVMIDKYGVNHVIIGEVLPIVGQPEIHPEEYNARVNKLNQKMRTMFHTDPKVHMCHHRSIANYPEMFSPRTVLQLEYAGIKELYWTMYVIISKFSHRC